jgi:hypothetical protein
MAHFSPRQNLSELPTHFSRLKKKFEESEVDFVEH